MIFLKLNKITKKEIETILQHEKDLLKGDKYLNDEEKLEYLSLIKNEMESFWTNIEYNNYWKNSYFNISKLSN